MTIDKALKAQKKIEENGWGYYSYGQIMAMPGEKLARMLTKRARPGRPKKKTGT